MINILGFILFSVVSGYFSATYDLRALRAVESIEVKVENGNPVVYFKKSFFDTGDYVVPNELKKVISGLGKVICSSKFNKRYFYVEGHTDDQGNDTENKTLSLNRAKAVTEELKSIGCEADRLDYIGLGYDNPLCSTKDEACRQKNRRVQIVIIRI